jgi:hypothetical protein
MVGQIKAEEALARACASLSVPDLQRLVNALQEYHGQYYNELMAAGSDTIVRAQGKVIAISQITNVALDCRTIIQKIDQRRATNQTVNGTPVGAM